MIIVIFLSKLESLQLDAETLKQAKNEPKKHDETHEI